MLATEKHRVVTRLNDIREASYVSIDPMGIGFKWMGGKIVTNVTMCAVDQVFLRSSLECFLHESFVMRQCSYSRKRQDVSPSE